MPNKHTPGPWKVVQTKISQQLGGTHSIIQMKDSVAFDTVTPLAITDAEAKANARLISAAPSLYEALKNLMQFEEDMQPLFDRHPSAQHPWNQARKALAKAEGKE